MVNSFDDLLHAWETAEARCAELTAALHDESEKGEASWRTSSALRNACDDAQRAMKAMLACSSAGRPVEKSPRAPS